MNHHAHILFKLLTNWKSKVIIGCNKMSYLVLLVALASLI